MAEGAGRGQPSICMSREQDSAHTCRTRFPTQISTRHAPSRPRITRHSLDPRVPPVPPRPPRPPRPATMPASFHVPVLVAGMLLTVRPSLLPPAPRSPPTGLQQLPLEQVAGTHHPPLFPHPHSPGPLSRTCNASRTAPTLIPQTTSSTSSLYGRPSKCSVRPHFRLHSPTPSPVTVRASRGNAL